MIEKIKRNGFRQVFPPCPLDFLPAPAYIFCLKSVEPLDNYVYLYVEDKYKRKSTTGLFAGVVYDIWEAGGLLWYCAAASFFFA